MVLGLSKYLMYKPNTKLLLVALCLSLATFVIYLQYFDVLAPGIPDGSVRANSGVLFSAVAFLLLGGQTLFDMWLTHVSISFASPEQRDALKAYLVASFQILLFSVYYVIFPYYGPYIFVVYFMPGQGFGPWAYPVLVVWTLVIVLGTYSVTQRTFRIENGPRFGTVRKLLLASATLALILVMAS
jgi:hypothetical protein